VEKNIKKAKGGSSARVEHAAHRTKAAGMKKTERKTLRNASSSGEKRDEGIRRSGDSIKDGSRK